ncbi:uncharacterized protein At5g50100, chloroplastic-like [Hippoglossus hippoglossus]|uniref:uncharacterized protein At5g50100, chloroplastic-like n=1 Tax=Hippoglossus hippoglossus TaxID=8267 RepID=UPI00148CABF2|nr:uncharacterized protein At5g50100, chloroplastic-like [Hippoglossus hippoglossus]
MFSTVRTCLASRLSALSALNSAAVRPTCVPCRLHLHRTFSSESSAAAVRVLYDGLCPVCVTEIRFLQFLQRKQPQKVDFVNIAQPGYDGGKYKDVSYEMAMEEMHVIDEKDEVHRGIPAFAVMYGGVGLGWLGRFMMWPGVRPFMDKSYAIFARNRLKWTGRGEECTSGRCEKKTH